MGVEGRARVLELTKLDSMSEHVSRVCRPSVWSTVKEKEVRARRRKVWSRVGVLPPTP